jgi:hypothetical protein
MDPLKLREIVFPNLWNFVDKNNILLIVISKNYSAIRELDCILVFDTTTGMIACVIVRLILIFRADCAFWYSQRVAATTGKTLHRIYVSLESNPRHFEEKKRLK